MKRYLLTLAICYVYLNCHSQESSAQTPQFAVVQDHYSVSAPHKYAVTYSDGRTEEINDSIKVTNDHSLHFDPAVHIKIIEYLYKKGYELLSTNGGGSGAVTEFIFKHK